MIEALHLHPQPVRRHHLPRGQIVQRGAPQHGLFAARVHGHIAADAGRIRRGWIDRKHQPVGLRRFHHPPGDNPRAAMHGGIRLRQAGQHALLHGRQRIQLFGVNHRRIALQRHRAAGVAGATATRNNRQFQLDTSAHQRRHFRLGIGMQHHKRQLHAPVGRVRHMRHPRQPVELDVVALGNPPQHAQRPLAQRLHALEFRRKIIHRLPRQPQQLRHPRIVLSPVINRIQPMMQRLNQRRTPLGIVQQIILQIRIAIHHPDVAQHLVQHARRTPGAPLAAQGVNHVPSPTAEQTQHNLAVGKRSVVVGNFAQTCSHGGQRTGKARGAILPQTSATPPRLWCGQC